MNKSVGVTHASSFLIGGLCVWVVILFVGDDSRSSGDRNVNSRLAKSVKATARNREGVSSVVQVLMRDERVTIAELERVRNGGGVAVLERLLIDVNDEMGLAGSGIPLSLMRVMKSMPDAELLVGVELIENAYFSKAWGKELALIYSAGIVEIKRRQPDEMSAWISNAENKQNYTARLNGYLRIIVGENIGLASEKLREFLKEERELEDDYFSDKLLVKIGKSIVSNEGASAYVKLVDGLLKNGISLSPVPSGYRSSPSEYGEFFQGALKRSSDTVIFGDGKLFEVLVPWAKNEPSSLANYFVKHRDAVPERNQYFSQQVLRALADSGDEGRAEFWKLAGNDKELKQEVIVLQSFDSFSRKNFRALMEIKPKSFRFEVEEVMAHPILKNGSYPPKVWLNALSLVDDSSKRYEGVKDVLSSFLSGDGTYSSDAWPNGVLLETVLHTEVMKRLSDSQNKELWKWFLGDVVESELGK